MDTSVFLNISKIIERESKTTTYKFALLRGVIDIISDNSPFIKTDAASAVFPLGLLIEKWLIYYFPFYEHERPAPQINGTNKLAFQDELKEVINYYKSSGGLSVLFHEMRTRGVSADIQPSFLALVKKLRDTITKMPMRYLGSSINNGHYTLFKYQASGRMSTPVRTTEDMIRTFGNCVIPIEYYEAFRLFGSFLSGNDSILFKWADFSVTASGNRITTEQVLQQALVYPVTDRDMLVAKQVYQRLQQRKEGLHCVWTGDRLKAYDIDHMIPFSVWKNNDLWNLMPAKASVNHQKRDKIPSAPFLKQRKEAIISYWELMQASREAAFFSELRVSLLGDAPGDNWQQQAFERLLNTSDYLIHTRGYEAWQL